MKKKSEINEDFHSLRNAFFCFSFFNEHFISSQNSWWCCNILATVVRNANASSSSPHKLLFIRRWTNRYHCIFQFISLSHWLIAEKRKRHFNLVYKIFNLFSVRSLLLLFINFRPWHLLRNFFHFQARHPMSRIYLVSLCIREVRVLIASSMLQAVTQP